MCCVFNLYFQFLVENNISIAVTDSFGNTLRAMVPDSEIAKKYGCARTKTTAIMKTLAKEEVTLTTTYMSEFGYRYVN